MTSSNNSDAGTYKFWVRFTSANHEGWTCTVPLEIVMQAEVKPAAIAVLKLNKLVFSKDLVTKFTVKAGDTWSYTLPTATYQVLE